MLNNVSSSVFADSDSITLLPVVSAEWNHNLFNTPYITVAGTGTQMPKSVSSGTVLSADLSEAKPNFTSTTNKFQMSGGKGSVSYTVTANSGVAYKVVTYVKTNNAVPVMITSSGKGTSTQFGSSQDQADSLGWTKIITYIGSSGESDTISSFVYTITANALSGTDINPTVLFTEPEIYQTTLFDYKYHSLWPTESPFTYFRPGESYVSSGDIKCSFPTDYRKINSSVISGYSTTTYSPISPILQNPKFFLASSPVPVLKTALASDMSPYKYFVSDNESRSITAIYEKDLLTNKIVLKFNNIMATPTINISINGSPITVDSLTDITLLPISGTKNTGQLTIYWNASSLSWTKTPWSVTPKFDSAGALSVSTTVKKITVTQKSKTIKTEFASYTGASDSNTDIGSDLDRMHLVEVSPRLEIDLTDFVQDVSINKSLDSGNTVLPISSINTNDARIVLSGIPATDTLNQIVPIFSSQSDNSLTVLSNLLRKNIKFYVNFNLVNYTSIGTTPQTPSTYIPGGVFYSDSWDENDIQDVSIQCFDISRYLQSTPVPDYVGNLKNVFDIITNILDLAGFTDYDYDSLYNICNDKTSSLDLAYYYCNSKDSTILDALNKIFVAYQIGAYIDEYGIMKFLSLAKIIDPSNPAVLQISDSNIEQGGFSISNKAKPGKISLRYQTPKVKQSPSLQNATDPNIKNSPSFIYTTSNDVVWQQQTIDSVGFNYLNADMSETNNYFEINNNDLLDIFHTFNLDNNGYAVIENEVVSFVYKEYEISNASNAGSSITVSVKNNIELAAEIDKFIKRYNVALTPASAEITNVSADGVLATYYAENNFKTGDRVSISGMIPRAYNISGTVLEADPTSFIMLTGINPTEPITRLGEANVSADYDVLITPTGKITNVQRGMFGTVPSEHKRISVLNHLESKGLAEGIITDTFSVSPSSGNTEVINDKTEFTGEITDSLPSIDKIKVVASGTDKVIVYPENEVDTGYQTYSVKFDMPDQDVVAAGLFFNMESDISTSGAYFVELTRYNKIDIKTGILYDPPKYNYRIVIYDANGTTYSWADVTGEANSIDKNFSKIITKTPVDGKNLYNYVTDNAFNLKVVHYTSDGSDGENATEGVNKEVVSVFLNNVEVTGWQIPGPPYDEVTNPDGTGWEPTEPNVYTGMGQKPTIPANIVTGTKFGFFASSSPAIITSLYSTGEQPPVGSPTGVWYTYIGSVAAGYDPNTVVGPIFLKGGNCSNIYNILLSTGDIGSDWNCAPGTEAVSSVPPAGTSEDQTYYFCCVSGAGSSVVAPDSYSALSYANSFCNQLDGGGLTGGVYLTPQACNSEISLLSSIEPSQEISLFSEIAAPPTASLREIHATKKALTERSVSYFYQDREFLNGLVQDQPLSSNSPTYLMQTTPEISGINYYDVQYTTPAAVSVDVLPIEYMWYYFPGSDPEDQKNYQKKLIDEYSLAYSTPLNTGFRAKMAIANNSPNMVFLHKDSDEINQFTINLNLWTHEVVAPSDPEIIERVIDQSNLSEVVQLDSEWIQSKDAAYKMLKVIEMGMEGFSKEVSLRIFGNPLIQVGDTIGLTYGLNGIGKVTPQKYLVNSVSHDFSQGLSTSLRLNRLQ